MRIEGVQVSLRDFEDGDGPRLGSLLDVDRPWWRTDGPYFGGPTPEAAQAQLARFLDPRAVERNPRHFLGVEVGGVLIGTVTWYWEDEQTDWRRMGLTIMDETRWGQGHGSEALALWTSYLFDHTDALRLDFATYSGNPGMLAVGRHLAFVEEGRFRRARRWSGGVHDSVVMGVLREEWDSFRADWPATVID